MAELSCSLWNTPQYTPLPQAIVHPASIQVASTPLAKEDGGVINGREQHVVVQFV